MANHNSNNSLLVEQIPIPFNDFRADQVEPAIEHLVPEMKQRIQQLSKSSTPPSYESVLLALDRVTDPLDYAMSIVRHLESVTTTTELRAAYNAVQEPVSAFYTSIALDSELWSAVKAVAESDQAKRLSGVDKRYLEKTIQGFRRAGADLDAAGKEQLEHLDVALTKATTKFSEHVLDSTNSFELVITEEAKLAGLPPSARSAARASAQSKNSDGWRFTLQAPSYVALMTYLHDRSIRRTLWEAYSRRATEGEYDNRELILEILHLRSEKARLLGYTDFADLVLEERMARQGTQAQAFVEDLHAKTKPFFDRENETLHDFAKTLGLLAIEPWDVGYVAEKQRIALYDFDEEELRPYFSLDRVVAGMFDIFGRVLGIKVIEEPGAATWDPAVKYYRIQDDSDGQLLGHFYADWFPRENKRGGAWMDSLITGNPDAGEPHVGLICGNLTPPVGDTPSLLTHSEVETIFHEFGHLLHHTLSRVPIRSLAGTNVPWDFVELPSQIMENWTMERDALNLFARHYETGEPIPEDLFQKMKRARTFRSANGQMRQLGFALVDLKLHREYNPARDGDVLEYVRNILLAFTPATLPPGYGMIASFTHLFSSPVAYGAGYYSYKWAEVLDADAFTRFQKEGIFNAVTGRAYRQTILERGNSQDPAELYRQFMGRNPDANALLVRLGLRRAA